MEQTYCRNKIGNNDGKGMGIGFVIFIDFVMYVDCLNEIEGY